jgi:plastocyanin
MSKGLRAATAAAVLTVAAVGSGPAWADHTPGAKGAAACAPSGTALALTAEHHKFDKDCLAATAGESFTIRFDNRDADRHNVAILPSHTSTETIFAGDIVPGPKSTVYAVPNLKAGTYHFHCEVHPNLMNGTFVVAAPPAQAKAATPPPMTMGEDKAAAQAAPTTAAPKAPAPRTAAAAAPATGATPAPAHAAGAAAAAGTSTAADTPLPHTGPGTSRLLLLLAGLALAAGGLSVLGGARARG